MVFRALINFYIKKEHTIEEASKFRSMILMDVVGEIRI